MLVPGGQYKKSTLQSAVTATENGAVVAPTSMTGGAFTCLLLQVKGITTATITWEARCNGSDWVAITAKDLTTGAEATTATADGLYRVIVAGLLEFRARVSSYTSGTITVTGVMTT